MLYYDYHTYLFISQYIKDHDKHSLQVIFIKQKHEMCVRHNTCSELKIANIHENATVSSSMASSPNTHVQPSTEIRIKAAFIVAL